MPSKVLISGAGIAGCTLAWWLDRYGYDVTVVEHAAEPRRGGYVLDFWGLGYEVADRMGLVAELRALDLAVEEFRIVDTRGRRVSGIDQRALGELTGGRVFSLQRSALAKTLYEAVKDKVAIRFGDSVTALEQAPDAVSVRFRHAQPAQFDLVIGADGLHSAIRTIAMGVEPGFEHFLGYCVGAFTAKGYPHRDPHAYVTYGEPGRQIWRITMADDISVFLLVFADVEPPHGAIDDPARQKQILMQRYAGCGWEGPEVLRALEGATDLYFDRVSQISVPRWSAGRIALIGDACACPSLLAGEGSAMAMAEACTLAGELDAAGGNHAQAFASFERLLRPYVERKQRAARGFASSFVPRSAFGLWARNFVIEAVGRLGLTRQLFKAQLNDPLELKAYR